MSLSRIDPVAIHQLGEHLRREGQELVLGTHGEAFVVSLVDTATDILGHAQSPNLRNALLLAEADLERSLVQYCEEGRARA